jgi:hypothetical protein
MTWLLFGYCLAAIPAASANQALTVWPPQISHGRIETDAFETNEPKRDGPLLRAKRTKRRRIETKGHGFDSHYRLWRLSTKIAPRHIYRSQTGLGAPKERSAG